MSDTDYEPTEALGPLATPEEVKSFRDAQAEEYGSFVANQPIFFNGVLAYNAGDPVPASNVARHGYDEQGLVHKAGSKEAGEVIQAVHAAGHAQPQQIEPVTLGVPLPE